MIRDDMTIDEFYENRLFVINKRFLCVIGRWPFQSSKKRIGIGLTIWFELITVIIPEIIYVIEVSQDISKVIDCLMALISTYAAVVIFFNCVITFDKMKMILVTIKNNWMNLRDKDEVEIYYEFAENGRKLILFYTTSFCSTILVFILLPWLPTLLDKISPLNESRPRETMLEVEYFVDHNKYFFEIWVHNVMAAIGVVGTILVVDAYFVMIVQAAISMFAVLGHRLNNLNYENITVQRRYSDKDKQDTLMYGKVVECMSYHRECMRFCQMIEESFTMSLLLQVFANMIIISVTAVTSLKRTDDPEKMMIFLMITGSQTFRLFCICWCCQKIVDYSMRIHDDIWSMKWYDFPGRTKKLLVLMLMRSSRPCSITAGKIMSLNFQCYGMLMKTSGSYFTMILSTQ